MRVIFAGVASGRYIDVGAGDPVRGSNTYGLYRKGWTGYLVDPIADNVKASRWWRPRDRAFCALVGAIEGVSKFYQYDPYEYSTSSPESVARWEELGMFPKRVYPVEAITLASLAVSMTPESPSLISIDVEGNELPVLEGNDWDVTVPSVICVEEWDGLNVSTPVRRLLQAKDYRFVAYTGVSSVYVHRVSPFRVVVNG